MKKQLLTTTALVAASLIGVTSSANAMKLGLGGFQEAIMGFADQGSQVRKSTGFDAQHDGEIHFKAQQTLDNGLKIRTRVELESATDADTIDEAYIDVSGKWGAIRLGAEDNAASLMTTGSFGAWATNVASNLNFDTSDWVIRPAGHRINLTQRLDLGEGDSEKITYFTPRVSGFQLGASYIPSGEEDLNSSIAPTNNGLVHGWAGAANYRGKVGGVGVRAAAGYITAKQAGGSQSFVDTEGDPKGWTASTAIKMSGVTVAAGFMSRKNIGAGAGRKDGSNEFSFGTKYDFGKNHVSAGYAMGKVEATRANAADDKSDRLMISYRRDLAKGISYRLNFIYADFQGETAGNADDNEGVALSTSLRVSF